MNTHFTLHGLVFEWDSRKAAANLRKHGVLFEAAAEIFHDPFVMVVSEEDVDGELRQTALGITVTWQLLLVIFVFRTEAIRIISARPVTTAERKQYEQQ